MKPRRDNFAGRHVMLKGARDLLAAEIPEARGAFFRSKLAPADDAGCLSWRGAANGDGYGVMRLVGARTVLVHRVAVALARGICPATRQVDHLCMNRLCCNVEHIRLATHEENSPGVYGIDSERQAPRGIVGWGPPCACVHAQLIHRGKDHLGSCTALECALAIVGGRATSSRCLAFRLRESAPAHERVNTWSDEGAAASPIGGDAAAAS